MKLYKSITTIEVIYVVGYSWTEVSKFNIFKEFLSFVVVLTNLRVGSEVRL